MKYLDDYFNSTVKISLCKGPYKEALEVETIHLSQLLGILKFEQYAV